MQVVVREIAGKVAGLIARKESPDEANTRRVLIDPILRALGWDFDSWDEVRTEHSVHGDRVDYAFFVHDRVILFVEAKKFGHSLDDVRVISQAVNYANAEGVAWCVLTNGREWRVYRVHEPVPPAQKLFKKTDLAVDEVGVAATVLALISKAGLMSEEIDRAWQRDVEDRKVRAALVEGIPAEAGDVLRVIKERCPSLTTTQVRQSLTRVLGIPEVPPDPGGAHNPAPPLNVKSPTTEVVPVEMREKAALGLATLKDAILDYVLDRTPGARNSEVAKDLELKSYRGSPEIQRNMLTQTLLWMLENEGLIVQQPVEPGSAKKVWAATSKAIELRSAADISAR